MPAEKRYWFPAKRYGWGWGLPAAWQGWVVLLTFVALLALGAVIFPPSEGLGSYLGFAGLLAVALIVVAWWKGEPPHWRWRGD